MRKQIFLSCVAALALLFTTSLSAQLQMPAPSPSAKLETTIGLTDVTVEYSRPQMRERTIFAADGLVPYGEVWRTGANQATKVTFSTDVMLGGEKVSAGSYAILTKPMADKWMVMFYPYEGGNWGSYREKDPAATVEAKSKKTSISSEAFTIGVNNYTVDGAHLTMQWDKTMVAIPVTTNAKEAVMANIERVMAGPSANDYFSAAGFLAENGDAKQALEYAQKANMMTGDRPRYWMLRREAELLAKNGMKAKAVEVATRSMKLAEEAGNMDYVRLNKKIIEENSKK